MEGNESLSSGYSSGLINGINTSGEILENLSNISPDIISDYILNETKLTSNVVSQLLQGENNVLRANITTLINNGLAKKISSKKCIGQLVITENLTTEQRISLTQAFTELDLTFTDTNRNSHAYAAASRKCERAILLKKIGVDLSTTKRHIRVKDVGGDIVGSILNNEYDIHCCSPILDVYDSKRLSQRVHRAINKINSGVLSTGYATETLIEYINAVSNNLNSKSESFCFNKSQQCDVGAEALLFLHSVYDMSLVDLADSMVRSKALVGYGSFVFDSKIFESDQGYIDVLDVDYTIERNVNGRRTWIKFGFRNCSGFNYCHRYIDYISMLTKSQFVSSTGERFSLELLENRNGIQFFSIVRLITPRSGDTYHRLYFKHLSNKYIIRFPKLCYDLRPQNVQTFFSDFLNYMFDRKWKQPVNDKFYQSLTTSATIGIFGSKNKYQMSDLVKDTFWENLPPTTQWMTFTVDKDIVDRTCAFVLVATEEKFKPEQILSYLRSITTREVMYTSVASKSKLPEYEELIALAHAIYIVLYQQKYVNGKILQQAINETNALRRNGLATDSLGEFSQRLSVFNWLLIKMGLRKMGLFDPSKFIIEPPTYLEIRTDAFSKSTVVDENWNFYLNLDDLIVVEELLPVDQCPATSTSLYSKKSCCSPSEVKISSFSRAFHGVSEFVTKYVPQSVIEDGLIPLLYYDTRLFMCYQAIRCFHNSCSVNKIIDKGDSEFETSVTVDKEKNKREEVRILKGHSIDGDCVQDSDVTNFLDTEKEKEGKDKNGKIDSSLNKDLSDEILMNKVFKRSDSEECQLSRGTCEILESSDSLCDSYESGVSEFEGSSTDGTYKSVDSEQSHRFLDFGLSGDYSFSKTSVCVGLDSVDQTDNSRHNNEQVKIKSENNDVALGLIIQSNTIGMTDDRIVTINGERYIDVSSANNECCFRAVCENRSININELRESIIKGVTKKEIDAVDSGYSELCEELTFGKMAGFSFLRKFSDMYNVGIVVEYKGEFYKIWPRNVSAKVRTINLLLLDQHYYYKLTCRESYIDNYLQQGKFYPYNVLSVKTLLKNKGLQFKLFKDDTIDGKNLFQTYYVNNLDHYCPLHLECRNNGLLKYCNLLNTNSNNKLILSFEKSNFDEDLANKILTSTGCNLTPIDVVYPGYLFMLLYKATTKQSIDFSLAYKNFMRHNCVTGNSRKIVGFDSGFIRTCLDKITTKTLLPEKIHDFVIIIQRSSSDTIVDYKDHSKLVLNGKGSYTICENISEIILKYISVFGKLDFVVHTRVLLISDFSNVTKFVDLLKNRSYSLCVEIRKCELMDLTTPVNFLPDDSDLNIMKNAMKEIHLMWTKEFQVIENQLKINYDNYISTKIINNNNNIIVDNSLVVLDVYSCKYVYGNCLNPPYNYAYGSDGLINISGFFNIDGTLNAKAVKAYRLKSMRRSDGLVTPYLVMNSASKLVNGLSLSKRHSVCEIDTFRPSKITFIQGVPGAGKTEYILNRNDKKKNNNLILTVTKEAQRDMVVRAKRKNLKISQDRIRTLDSFLLNYVTGTMIIDEVWMDEALLAHCGTWMWVMFLSRCSEMYVVGDRAQIPYINRNGLEHAYSVPRFNTIFEYLTVDYRNPLDIVLWLKLNKFYKFDITGTSSVIHSVNLIEIVGVSDIPNKNDAKYLTFTQSEKTVLVGKGFDAYTIHEFQGSQHDNICLVRLTSRDTDVIYKSVPHILVGLTRHKLTFTYYTTLISDSLSKFVRDIQQYPDFEIKQVKVPDLRGGARPVDFHEFSQQVVPDKALVLFKQSREIRDILLDNHGTGYIPFYFRNNYSYSVCEEFVNFKSIGEVNVLQDFNDRVFPGSSIEFNQHDHDMYEYTPVLLSGNVTVNQTLPIFKKYDYLQPVLRTSIQKPLHQSVKVSLKAFLERNGNVPCLQGTIDDFKESQKLFCKFKLLLNHKRDFRKYPITHNYSSLEKWLYSQPPNVKKIIVSEDSFYDQKFSYYEFIIKTIPKIDLEINAQFRYKSPQTIAFQQKTLNSVFCPLLKDFMDRVIFSLDPNIVLYNAMSPQEFAKHFTNIFPPERYKTMSKFLEVDFSKYDKSQGLVILLFEALILEYFGVPREYVKLWIIMHRYTTIIDKVNGFKANVEYQRKSGDAGTWRMNTLVQIAILNSVFDLWLEVKNNNCVACFSGDDSLIFLKNQIFDVQEKTFRLQTLYNMEAKLMNYNIPYFCSKFLIIVEDEWIFVPDTLKLIIKLGRHDLVDYEHVECYRVSYFDNLYYYKNKKNWPYISYAINDRYKLYGEHDIIYCTLLALGSDKDVFATLYIKPPNFDARKTKISIKPKLDI